MRSGGRNTLFIRATKYPFSASRGVLFEFMIREGRDCDWCWNRSLRCVVVAHIPATFISHVDRPFQRAAKYRPQKQYRASAVPKDACDLVISISQALRNPTLAEYRRSYEEFLQKREERRDSCSSVHLISRFPGSPEHWKHIMSPQASKVSSYLSQSPPIYHIQSSDE